MTFQRKPLIEGLIRGGMSPATQFGGSPPATPPSHSGPKKTLENGEAQKVKAKDIMGCTIAELCGMMVAQDKQSISMVMRDKDGSPVYTIAICEGRSAKKLELFIKQLEL